MAQVSSSNEPDVNLIPLLDLVLQLVMFFIMVANFAAQETTADVVLPQAVSARPPEAGSGDSDILYVNLNADGQVLVPGREPMKSIAEVRYHLKSEFDTAKRTAEARGEKEVRTVVIIRADKNADFKPVYEVLRACQQAGFRKWQLRATVKNQQAG